MTDNLKVWNYTALRGGVEIAKGRCIARSHVDCIERSRQDWKSAPPPDDWKVYEASITVEQFMRHLRGEAEDADAPQKNAE